jgi:hypothetical protein
VVPLASKNEKRVRTYLGPTDVPPELAVAVVAVVEEDTKVSVSPCETNHAHVSVLLLVDQGKRRRRRTAPHKARETAPA